MNRVCVVECELLDVPPVSPPRACTA
uniref:Uncharacterized protein n=1 Tax=Arundo donax TaxID=35708 RepID=A0A0A9CLB9_ARUDO